MQLCKAERFIFIICLSCHQRTHQNTVNGFFPILFELEKRIDITQYDNYQKRVFGFIAERLFNVWLVHHQLKFCEIPVVNLEGENLLKKAINLLKRKFLR